MFDAEAEDFFLRLMGALAMEFALVFASEAFRFTEVAVVVVVVEGAAFTSDEPIGSIFGSISFTSFLDIFRSFYCNEL